MPPLYKVTRVKLIDTFIVIRIEWVFAEKQGDYSSSKI